MLLDLRRGREERNGGKRKGGKRKGVNRKDENGEKRIEGEIKNNIMKRKREKSGDEGQEKQK